MLDLLYLAFSKSIQIHFSEPPFCEKARHYEEEDRISEIVFLFKQFSYRDGPQPIPQFRGLLAIVGQHCGYAGWRPVYKRP